MKSRALVLVTLALGAFVFVYRTVSSLDDIILVQLIFVAFEGAVSLLGLFLLLGRFSLWRFLFFRGFFSSRLNSFLFFGLLFRCWVFGFLFHSRILGFLFCSSVLGFLF